VCVGDRTSLGGARNLSPNRRGVGIEDSDSERLEGDRLRSLPQGQPAELRQVLGSRDDRQEMVTGELSDLAGEADAAIGEEDLGLADAAGVEQELARRRIARGILVAEAEVEIAERDRARLAAPSHMDLALPVREHVSEFVAGMRRRGALKARREGERAGGDANICHDRVYRPISAERQRCCRRRLS
jgi:hypothetical protein